LAIAVSTLTLFGVRDKAGIGQNSTPKPQHATLTP